MRGMSDSWELVDVVVKKAFRCRSDPPRTRQGRLDADYWDREMILRRPGERVTVWECTAWSLVKRGYAELAD